MIRYPETADQSEDEVNECLYNAVYYYIIREKQLTFFFEQLTTTWF